MHRHSADAHMTLPPRKRIGPTRRNRVVAVAAAGARWLHERVLNNLRRKLSQTIEEIEDERLSDRSADLGVTRINDAPTRTPILVGGEIQGLQVVPRAGSPSLEVTISDGSGRAVAVFTGRRRLGGVDCGRRVLIEGVGRMERGRLVVVNPAYTIVE